MEWYMILLICVLTIIIWLIMSILLYRPFFKRFYDLFLSGLFIIVLSPLFIILTIIGAIVMKGNPFFTQERVGKNEKIFMLIKFRTMTCQKDEKGNLLPDEKRLVKYGKILRSTSLDELPELFNIFFGNMSIVGPRPLLVRYLPYYTDEERRRHNVKPGLTGYSQVHGRNRVTWEDKFKMDLYYVNNFSFFLDLKLIIQTFFVALKHSNVESASDSIVVNNVIIQPLDVERSKK